MCILCQEHATEYKPQDPHVDQKLIESIDRVYFNDDQTFDVVEYDLQVSGDFWRYVLKGWCCVVSYVLGLAILIGLMNYLLRLLS